MALRLVPDDLSHDTVELCEQLLELARSKRLKGLGFVGVYPGGDYIGNTAGAAHADPTRTRGMLMGLDDKLSVRVHGGRASSD